MGDTEAVAQEEVVVEAEAEEENVVDAEEKEREEAKVGGGPEWGLGGQE